MIPANLPRERERETLEDTRKDRYRGKKEKKWSHKKFNVQILVYFPDDPKGGFRLNSLSFLVELYFCCHHG